MGLKAWFGRKLFLRWLRGKAKGWQNMKAWQALDGWKLLIGSVAYVGVLVYDGMTNGNAAGFAGSVLAVFGFDPVAAGEAAGVNFPKLAAGVGMTIGGLHKLWKAQAQKRAGAKASELLSAPGYVREAHRRR